MPAPFTAPVAWSTPFEAEPDRPNGFTSKNVQLAIEEALALAVSNDVFLILAQYGGNANTGRHLLFYSGIDSEDAPLRTGSGNTNVIALVAATTSSAATCKVGFYNNSVSSTIPLYELPFVNEKEVEIFGSATSPLFIVPPNARLEIRISEGSILTPHLQMVFSSAQGS